MAGNNPTAYASTVAGSMGVRPNTPLNMNDPNVRAQLAAGMTRMENGVGGQQRPIQTAQASPNNGMAAFYMNPSIPKELKDQVMKTLTPTGVSDVYGRPGVSQIESGIHGMPVQGNYQPGVMTQLGVSAEGGFTTQVPLTGPGQYGGSNPQDSGTPTGGLAGTVGQFATMGRGVANQNAFNVAQREPQTAALNSDQKAFAQVGPTKQILGLLKNDISSAGGANVSWGPQSEQVQNAKKLMLNYFPGLFSKAQVEGISAGDSINKLSVMLGAGLGHILGNAGGTDFSQQLQQQQVPGTHNSRESALALANMIEQTVDQYRQLGQSLTPQLTQDFASGKQNYLQWRQNFYDQHPIINPVTKNPITQDLSKYTEAIGSMQGGWKNKSDAEVKAALKKAGVNLGP